MHEVYSVQCMPPRTQGPIHPKMASWHFRGRFSCTVIALNRNADASESKCIRTVTVGFWRGAAYSTSYHHHSGWGGLRVCCRLRTRGTPRQRVCSNVAGFLDILQPAVKTARSMGLGATVDRSTTHLILQGLRKCES
jgi:hypothetical protein